MRDFIPFTPELPKSEVLWKGIDDIRYLFLLSLHVLADLLYHGLGLVKYILGLLRKGFKSFKHIQQIIPIGPEGIGQLLSYICGGYIINRQAFERRKRGIAMGRPVISDFLFGFCGELKQLSYWAKHCVVKLWKSVTAKFHNKTILFKCTANIFASWEPWTCTGLQVQVGEIKNWNLCLCLDSHMVLNSLVN